jgi:hypothetical protein
MTNMHGVGTPGVSGLDGVARGGFSAPAFWDSARRQLLERRWSFFSCTQHDQKQYDFDGRMIRGGFDGAAQPLLGSQESPYYVPLRARRPSAPYRLARLIDKSFTSMLFGDHRFPVLDTPGDATTKDYAAAIQKAADIPGRFQRMRDIGGAVGTAACSWAYVLGKPRVRAHNAKNIHVHSWDDRDEFIPRHVTECFQYDRPVFDPERGRMVTVPHWYRRDWLPDADIVFLPVPVRRGVEPVFVPDTSQSYEHRDGICHFVMAQNLPDDDVDGEPDYEGQLENFDSLDIMLSIIVRGAVLNLDPTLKLKMDPDLVNRMGVRKGSDNALVVGEEGDAEYMELAGTSIDAGVKLFNEKRRFVLEVAQCVIPDPDKVAANGTSSVALKAMYKPMTDQTNILRGQYGPMLARLMEPLLTVARHRHGAYVTVYEPDDTEQLQPRVVQTYIDLPPRAVPDPSGELGADGLPKTVMVPREPGSAETVDPLWKEYFLPTSLDQQNAVTTLTQAAGGPGTAILSKKTATQLVAEALGRDGDAELAQMEKEQDEAEGKQAEMFASVPAASPGGSVKKKMTLPNGTSVEHQHAPPAPEPAQQPLLAAAPPPPDDDKGAPIPITPTAATSIVTVNEMRKQWGLSPIQGPDGDMGIAAYMAKYSAPIAISANAALGQLGASPVPPPSPPGGPPKPPGAPPGAGPPKPPGGPPGAPPAGPPKPPIPPPPVPPFVKE